MQGIKFRKFMDSIFIAHVNEQASGNINFIGKLNEVVTVKFIV